MNRELNDNGKLIALMATILISSDPARMSRDPYDPSFALNTAAKICAMVAKNDELVKFERTGNFGEGR